MEYVLPTGVIIVALCIYLAKRRRNAYVRAVADDVAAILRSKGEPEIEISNFLNSAAFRGFAKSAIGKIRVWDAVKIAFEEFQKKSARDQSPVRND